MAFGGFYGTRVRSRSARKVGGGVEAFWWLVSEVNSHNNATLRTVALLRIIIQKNKHRGKKASHPQMIE